MADAVQNHEAPATPDARLDRADWLSFAATALLTFTGYILTLAPSITLGWDGILTAGAMYGGVGPPQGYPVWTIYSWLFIHLLPFGNPGWRVAVGDAVAGALACGFVALIVSRSGKILFERMPAFERLAPHEQPLIRGISGYAAAMALGFSDDLWYQALVPNFWTMSVLLFVLVLFLLTRWWETGRKKFCWLAFFVYGLLLTNSQEMIVALPGIVGAILLKERNLGRDVALVVLPVATLVTSVTQFTVRSWFSPEWDIPLFAALATPFLVALALAIITRRIGAEWKSALACTFLLLLGLTPYLYLPIVSATDPPVNWAYSRTLEGFLHLIARGQFEHPHPVTSLTVFAGEVWNLIKQTCEVFGWLYIPFAILPFCLLHRMTTAGRKWISALLLISFFVGPLLAGLLNISSTDSQSQGLLEQYFYILRVPIALWIGFGLILIAAKAASFKLPANFAPRGGDKPRLSEPLV